MTPNAPRHRYRDWVAAAAFALAATIGCAPAPGGGDALGVREITPSFLLSLESHDPSLSADARGHVAVTWVTRDSAGADVWLSASDDSGASFSEPRRINVGSGRVVSFPEGRPEVTVGAGGALAVAWSERRADSTGATDLHVRASADFGRTFGRVATVNDDADGPPAGLTWRQNQAWLRAHRPDAFHGFPAITFLADGSLLAAWLDTRNTAGPGEPRITALVRSLSFDGGQSWSPNLTVSDSACPCCRPVLSAGPDDAVALSYRGGSHDVRDPRLALSADGGRVFATDTLISHDGWTTSACPVQGPSLVWNRAQGGHIAWFTGARPAGVYLVAWRRDGGAIGMRRAIDDSLGEADHPRVALLGEALLIGVMARAPGDAARRTFAVRALEPGGALSGWTFLGADATSAVLAGAGAHQTFSCWIEAEDGHLRLRLAALTRRGGVRG